MRDIPTALATHLQAGSTTTCHAWRVTRRDGVVLGFTEHDEDLSFGDTLYLAASGFVASEGEAAIGLGVSADEVAGGFSAEAISAEDLAAGRYDGARVELFLVNWADPTQHILLNLREIGEVSRAGGQFRAELRSLAHRLDQSQGRIYSRRCDAALGDARCRVDLTALQGAGEVVGISANGSLLVSGLGGFADGFFRHGSIDFGGEGQADVETHQLLSDGTAQLTLWIAPQDEITPGQAFTITAGCDKSFDTCKVRFANQLNFRGFPHLPGADFAYSYVDGERIHDGGALFK